MSTLGNSFPGDGAVEAGESGSVGVGVLCLVANNSKFEELIEALVIGPGSTALLLIIERAIGPENYIIFSGMGTLQRSIISTQLVVTQPERFVD